MPYIDKVLSPLEDLRIPRLTYKETALKAAEDFRAAADLLPIHWDKIEAGQATRGITMTASTRCLHWGTLAKIFFMRQAL